MEAYVDDFLVKSQTVGSFITDLRKVFEVFQNYQMRLNPKKCIFGVTSEKFLGYIVSYQGIEVNPDKVKAIQDMAPLKTVRKVQKLTGRLAALNRFLSKLA